MESNNKSKVFTYENGLLLLLGFTFGIVFFERNAIGPLASYIINDLALSQAQIGMLGSGLSLAWAIAAYVIGAWSDRTRSAQTVPARVGRGVLAVLGAVRYRRHLHDAAAGARHHGLRRRPVPADLLLDHERRVVAETARRQRGPDAELLRVAARHLDRASGVALAGR